MIAPASSALPYLTQIALSTSPPTPSPATSAANKADDQQEYQRADGGIDDRRNKAHAKVDIELGKQPAADEGTGNSNDEIADDPKPGASRDLTGQPSGNEADRQYDQEAFA
jgi:hypothetical protein